MSNSVFRVVVIRAVIPSLSSCSEKDNRGEYTQSTCRMYNVPLAAPNGSLDYESWKFTKEDIVGELEEEIGSIPRLHSPLSSLFDSLPVWIRL